MSHLVRRMSMFLILCLCYYISSATSYAGGPGSFYSYTATNHLTPSVPTLYSPLYKSSSPLYSYSYLPAASTAVIPPPLAYAPTVHTSVWPATTYLHKPYGNFYAPCLKHVTSFSHVITTPPLAPRVPLVGKPVKTKPNNNTEHVFKPIYYPGIWGEYKLPVFSYQGTIQHGIKSEKSGLGEAATTTTVATPTADVPAEEAGAEKPAQPAKAEETKTEDEVDPGEKEDEKADAAEATTKKAEEMAIKPAKAKRASRMSSSSVSIAKSYGVRKTKRRNVWNFRSA